IAILAPQTVNHGGPLAWVEPALHGVDAAEPPSIVHRIAAGDPTALAQSRDVLATARGALLWSGVLDALYPAGWATAGAPLLREGVLGLNGEERSATALRRSAMLSRAWAPLLPAMQRAAPPKPPSGKFPEGVTAALLISNTASALSVVNLGMQAFRD